MGTLGNVTYIDEYRQRDSEAMTAQDLIDDISARTFLFMRDEAAAAGVPIPAVIGEHLLGIALVVESVEGTESAKALLAAVNERLGSED